LNYPKYDFVSLRKLAADYIRLNSDDFAPFLGFDSTSDEFRDYCNKIESPTLAEWGGQIEVRAIANSLDCPVIIYDAESPNVIMGDVSVKEPLRISYHRHYYALGEHYNSVERV